MVTQKGMWRPVDKWPHWGSGCSYTRKRCEGISLVHLNVSRSQSMATHCSTFAWKIPWTEEPGRLQSMGSLSRARLSDFTFTFHFHALEKEMATHSSVLAWRIPGMGEPGGLLSRGLHRVGHDWSDLAAAANLLLSDSWRILAFSCIPFTYCFRK